MDSGVLVVRHAAVQSEIWRIVARIVLCDTIPYDAFLCGDSAAGGGGDLGHGVVENGLTLEWIGGVERASSL